MKNQSSKFSAFEDEIAKEGAAGSFAQFTHAAEAFASHAASQAAGFFSYKKEEEEAGGSCRSQSFDSV